MRKEDKAGKHTIGENGLLKNYVRLIYYYIRIAYIVCSVEYNIYNKCENKYIKLRVDNPLYVAV